MEYNPDKINLPALKEFFSALTYDSTGELVFNEEQLNMLTPAFKNMIQMYISHPEVFETKDIECDKECPGLGCIIDFKTKEKTYYCKLQEDCPEILNNKCPFSSEEEIQYAYSMMELKKALDIKPTHLDDPGPQGPKGAE